MSDALFKESLDSVLYGLRDDDGIGTLSERTLHAVLKRYFEPSALSREVKIGRFVADIVGEDGIIEIQTGALSRLRPKLEAFLPVARVTVVYPLAIETRVFYIDDAGEQRKGRKKYSKPIDVFSELYPIRDLLSHPNLTIQVMHLKIDEYYRPSEVKGLATKKRGKLRGTRRADRVPVSLEDTQIFAHPLDYFALCPDISGSFYSSDFAKAANARQDVARIALGVLTSLGLVTRLGRDRSGYLYRYCD